MTKIIEHIIDDHNTSNLGIDMLNIGAGLNKIYKVSYEMCIRLFIIALLISSNPVSAAIVGETTTTIYKNSHFSIDVPTSSEKQSYTPAANEEAHDLYISDGCAYDIRVFRPSDELPASTAIEKIIQEQIKSGSVLGSTSRWELDSKSKILFKGYSRFADITDPLLQKLFGGTRCVESIAMSALGDEFSAIVAVGVIGKIEQATDVENLAKFTAFSVNVLPAKPAIASSPEHIVPRTSPGLIEESPKAKLSTIPRPAVPISGATIASPEQVQSSVTPSITGSSANPKLSGEVKPAAPVLATMKKPDVQKSETAADKSRVLIQKLKNGQIQLSGVVESIDGSNKKLVMQVDQIAMPDSQPVKLSPVRQKIVLFSELPDKLSKGSRVLVIGANEGVGSAIKADFLAVL